MTGEIFWKRVPNAVRFLSDAVDELLAGESVLLQFPVEAPWKDLMTDVLAENLSPFLNTRSIDRYSATEADSPGEFLLHRYFSERERQNYWPAHGSVEAFMAKNRNSPMHHRIIFVTDIPEAQVSAWIASVSEYLEHAGDPDDAALFVLMTARTAFGGSDAVTMLDYSEYISDYDCLMLCMNLLSDQRCSDMEKKYISELSVRLADNRIEFAGQLAEYGCDLLRTPIGVVRTVMSELTDGEAAELTEQSLWEAQIRIVYPELEHFRRSMVRKYQSKLQSFLPMTDALGERITDPGDLELGQIFYICRNAHFADKRDFDRLCSMRSARNLLAHGNAIPYDELKKLGVL